MFAFDRSSITLCSFGQLEIGEFFISSRRGNSFVGVRIKDVQGSPAWLNLTGNHAFELDVDHQAAMKVIKFSIPNGAVKLRIDHASMAFNEDHRIGQLVVDKTDKASITAVWPELAEHNYNNTVRIDSWEPSDRQGQALLFDSWSLSYIDEAGQWVDIIRR